MSSIGNVQPHARPLSFALSELILDLTYILQKTALADYESILIMCCVNEATMRPFMLDPDLQPETLLVDSVPEEIRGSISRLLIADRTGLPRETVRRKINALAEKGEFLFEDDKGRIRGRGRLTEDAMVAPLEEMDAAVKRYIARLEQLAPLMAQARALRDGEA